MPYDALGNLQQKKGQGETNNRLERLYQEQQATTEAVTRTNQLLEWIGTMLHVQLTPEQRAEVDRVSAGNS